jgi:hypothetical protein
MYVCDTFVGQPLPVVILTIFIKTLGSKPDLTTRTLCDQLIFCCCIFFGGLECVGHSFAYLAHLVFLRDVWIRTQRATVASRRATSLATHLPA